MGTARGRWVLLATVLGSGLAMLDATVVNVALVHIGEDLGAGFSGLQWTVNAYTLTLASFILLGGSLGDRLGRRRVFVVGVVWFALASALCGLAGTVEQLIAARALQGVGGALLTPGSLALISASFHGEDRARAVGAWSGLGGIAGALGPFLGGWLVEWSWRAVFWINVPVAVLVVAVAARHVPESRDEEATGRLDLLGTLLAAGGLAALTFGLTALGEGGGTASTGTATAVAALGVALLAVFVVVERRTRQPLVPVRLFRDAQFSAANAVTFLVYAALGVLFVLLVLQLQVVSGFSPLAAGTAVLPVTVVMLLFSSRAGALAQRIGPRIPMTLGPLVAAGGVLGLSRVGEDASYVADVLVPVTAFGAGLALMVAPLTATVLDSAPDRYAGVASGINNAVARAAGLLAVAVVPVAAGIQGGGYAEDPAGFADGFTRAMLLCAGLLVLGAVLAAALVRRPLEQDPEDVAERVGPAGHDDPAEPEREPEPRLRIEDCLHCGVTSPQLHPGGRAGVTRAGGAVDGGR